MHDHIFDLLMKEDDISWQTILHDLVRKEGLDPWDVDVSKLTQGYINMLKQMQQLNLAISGKVLLASAILLKLKSSKLLDEDLYRLDAIMRYDEEEEEDGFGDDYEDEDGSPREKIKPILLPKTPQPRKRKVSIYDLIEALQKALEGKKRRALREILDETPAMQAPEKKVDITVIIKQLSEKIDLYFDKVGEDIPLKFDDLVASPEKEDQVMTFIPLLQLCNDRRIDMHQQESFDDIHITRILLTKEELLAREAEREKELAKEEKKKGKKQPAKKVKAKKDAIDVSKIESARDSITSALDQVAEETKVIEGDNTTIQPQE